MPSLCGQKMGYGTAQASFFFHIYLCRSIAAQDVVAYLASAFDSNDTLLFSCLRLPFVTSCKTDETKASTAPCEHLGFTALFSSLTDWSWENGPRKIACIHIHNAVKIRGNISLHKLVWQA